VSRGTIVFCVGVAVGGASGLGAATFLARGEPPWATEIRHEVREQAMALDAMSRVFGNAASGHSVASGGERCLTLAELREALATPSRAQTPPAKDETSVAAVKARELAGENARDEALGLVQKAIASGSWGDDQSATLRPLMGQMTGEQRDAVLSAITMAINEQRLKLSGHAPF
jgi:hypothetical protein